MQELNDRRSLQRSLKRGSVFTSDAAEAVNERTRFISTREYGVPLFQIDEVVTIVKDTTPGAHFRHFMIRLVVSPTLLLATSIFIR